MRIAVSGTSSSIGRAVVRELSEQGIEIAYLTRTGLGERFDLSDPIKLHAENLDAFIHLAWDWSESYAKGHRHNVENILPFLHSLATTDTKMVLLSSESASGIPESNYGKLKRELEQEFSTRGGTSIRAGLIWGSSISGIVATVARLSQVPFFCVHLDPDPNLFVSNETEIAKALVFEAVTRGAPHTVFSLKSKESIQLSKISHCCQDSTRKRLHLRIRVKNLVLIGEFMRKLHFKLPFRVDSLRSILAVQQNAPEIGVLEQSTQTTTDHFIRWIAQYRSHRE